MKDIGTIDELLPFTFFDTLEVYFKIIWTLGLKFSYKYAWIKICVFIGRTASTWGDRSRQHHWRSISYSLNNNCNPFLLYSQPFSNNSKKSKTARRKWYANTFLKMIWSYRCWIIHFHSTESRIQSLEHLVKWTHNNSSIPNSRSISKGFQCTFGSSHCSILFI